MSEIKKENAPRETKRKIALTDITFIVCFSIFFSIENHFIFYLKLFYIFSFEVSMEFDPQKFTETINSSAEDEKRNFSFQPISSGTLKIFQKLVCDET